MRSRMMRVQYQATGAALMHKVAFAVVRLAIVLVSVLCASQALLAQDYRVLYTFTGRADGGYPAGNLLRDAQGNLYGTTYSGGTHSNGVIFKLDVTGKETVLHSFHTREGIDANGGLVQDQAGNLYGTAFYGGSRQCDLGCGTLFKLSNTGKLTVLHVFTGGADGNNPASGLVRDPAGNLIGITYRGGGGPCDVQGTPGCGVIFKLNPSTGQYSVLYSFTGGTDGSNPHADLIQDASGNLYGTASYSGTPGCGCGTVFKLDAHGRYAVLYSFAGGADGGTPAAGVLRDAAGNLYGTTYFAGDFSCDSRGCGTLFKLTPASRLIVLHTFKGLRTLTGQGEGANPEQDLVQDNAGALYSMALDGGVNDGGVLFKLNPHRREKVLHSYASGWSFGGLVPDNQGHLYGTTYNTGLGNGTVFSVAP